MTIEAAPAGSARRAELRARALAAGRGLLLFALLLSASGSVTYFHVARHDLSDPATGGREGDVAQYVRMAGGAPLTEIPKPYRYRIAVPWLVRLVPPPPAAADAIFDITPDRVIAFRFGVVNCLSLALAAWLLAAWMARMGFSPEEGLLGALLFLTSFFVVNYAGVPIVDASSYATLLAALLALQARRFAWLALAVAVGALVRETVFLVVAFAPLLCRRRRDLLWALLACAPALLAYGVLRSWILPTEVGYAYDPATLLRNLQGLARPQRLARLAVDGALCFGACWLLAGLGWRSLAPGHPLRRATWILPLVVAIPLLIGANIGRVWFLAFPVVLPLAVAGLRMLLPRSEH